VSGLKGGRSLQTKAGAIIESSIFVDRPTSSTEIENYINSKSYSSHLKGGRTIVAGELGSAEALTKEKDFYFILIQDKADKVGHWSFLMRYTQGSGGMNPAYIYFDSFGHPVVPEVMSFLDRTEYYGTNKNHCLALFKNHNDIQNKVSSKCGAYALYVLDKLFETSVVGSGFRTFCEILSVFDLDASEKNVQILIDHF